MARHNQEGKGVDQRGELWLISYQPDWLKQVKISRKLPGNRRRSSLTLFRNPARRAQKNPGRAVRTRISAADGSMEIQLSLEDRDHVVERIIVEMTRKRGRQSEPVRFVIQGGMTPPAR
ncbi:MAG: hypothetical protein ACE5HQ_01185 [Gemmatimonadota bacterium]